MLGLVSSKLGHADAKGALQGRINSRIAESKRFFLKNTCLQRGAFQDLQFASYLRFNDENKLLAQDLFY